MGKQTNNATYGAIYVMGRTQAYGDYAIGETVMDKVKVGYTFLSDVPAGSMPTHDEVISQIRKRWADCKAHCIDDFRIFDAFIAPNVGGRLWDAAVRQILKVQNPKVENSCGASGDPYVLNGGIEFQTNLSRGQIQIAYESLYYGWAGTVNPTILAGAKTATDAIRKQMRCIVVKPVAAKGAAEKKGAAVTKEDNKTEMHAAWTRTFTCHLYDQHGKPVCEKDGTPVTMDYNAASDDCMYKGKIMPVTTAIKAAKDKHGANVHMKSYGNASRYWRTSDGVNLYDYRAKHNLIRRRTL